MLEKKIKTQEQWDEYFMRMALLKAFEAFEQGEVPVGAILTFKNKVIMKAHNQVELLKDVTAHAELIAISSAGEHLQAKYLKDCTLYVTLEPCAMCAGAIGWAQIGRLVFGAEDVQKGYRITAPQTLHPKCEVNHGLLADECESVLKTFFQQRRK